MRLIGAVILAVAALAANAGPAEVQGVRLWAAPDYTRVVFDISGPVDHTLFSLQEPDRLVLDLKDARRSDALPELDYEKGLIYGVRSAPRNGDDLRVVFDLKAPVRPKSFLLRPNEHYGHRLVIDLHDPEHQGGKSVTAETFGGPGARNLVIAIDAGHGGEDPGARGGGGTREKDVVLAIARRLAALVEHEPGMRPVLIREGDYYIGLRERIEKARAHQADLFVSIHADAFRDRRVSGSSVYVLSRRGATTEAARWLAERENSADLIGGVSLDDKDDLLASVLLDLSQAATIEASIELADQVLTGLKRVGKVHKQRVEQAGFVVLKSPDIPSLLVETAFISNPAEERRLRDRRHQEALARAMMAGIRSYFAANAPPGTLVAARQHIIQSGDTLIQIARLYNVSLDSLRAANGLAGDRLHVGDVLRIPTSSDS